MELVERIVWVQEKLLTVAHSPGSPRGNPLSLRRYSATLRDFPAVNNGDCFTNTARGLLTPYRGQ